MDSFNKLDAGSLANFDVVILGAGISGITTAITIQSLGFSTAIVASARPMQKACDKQNAHLPTEFAMASAYPHNLLISSLWRISFHTQQIFGALLNQPGSGIAKYKMFELFENAPTPDAAPLSEQRMNFSTFEGTPQALKQSVDPPMRPGAEYLWGWQFDTYFADMPIYLDFLWQLFTTHGGAYYQHHVDIDAINLLASKSIIINCLGAGAIEPFADKTPSRMVRGKQIIAHGAPIIKDNEGFPLCYNYTPIADVFRRADGNAEYVHFFPRNDGWVLGQTREAGQIDKVGNWTGAAVNAEEITLNNICIPKPILTLNQSILQSWKNVAVNHFPLTAREGYRYYRDPVGTGVRLEVEHSGDRLLVHNYGHGGSGITMSWGASIECASMIAKAKQLHFPVSAANEIAMLLQTCVARCN